MWNFTFILVLQTEKTRKILDVDLVMKGFGDSGNLLKIKARELSPQGELSRLLPTALQAEPLQPSSSAHIRLAPYPHTNLNSYHYAPNKLLFQVDLPILANAPNLNRFVLTNALGYSMIMKNTKHISQSLDAAFTVDDLKNWPKNIRRDRTHLAWQG